jgi:hypothetical protein
MVMNSTSEDVREGRLLHDGLLDEEAREAHNRHSALSDCIGQMFVHEQKLSASDSTGLSDKVADMCQCQHVQDCSLTLISSALEVKADRPPNSLASFLGTPRTMGICSRFKTEHSHCLYADFDNMASMVHSP